MANCETCKIKTSAPENVPYIVHESALARMERMVKRLWIAVLVLIFLLVGTNGAWLWYESQFEDVVTTTTIEAEQDGSGVNIVGAGDVTYGAEGESNQND